MQESAKNIFAHATLAFVFQERRVQRSDVLIKWLPVIPISTQSSSIGITSTGEWSVANTEGVIFLYEPQSFITTLPLLEQPRSSILQHIHHASLSNAFSKVIEETFPEVAIVRMGFEIGSDYWARHAFRWFDEFPIDKQQELLASVQTIVQAKWASQQVRQHAQRAVSSIKSRAEC